jgi:hypothetical protein
VKQLTKDMEEQIRGGTLDAPSWEILRIGLKSPHLHISGDSSDPAARVAQRLYAPLGTELSLGEYVRLTQRFVDLFAHKKRRLSSPAELKSFNFEMTSEHEGGFVQGPAEVTVDDDNAESIDQLAKDLKVRPPLPTPLFSRTNEQGLSINAR